MDREKVIEFLGEVPLLQPLPSSSLRKIAEVVEFKHYDRGDYIVREGEIGDGIYFIWDGMAEVSEPLYVEEGNSPEIHLKKYDYFGYGTITSVHQTNVIALTKLTCLVLHHQHSALLKPKSIWHADEAVDSCSLVEQILRLEPIEVNVFRGFTLPDAPKFAQVFGGQFMGQALAAASKTVDCLKLVHSLHSYFLLVGDLTLPIIYQVHRLRDGNSFATRRVDAMQRGNVVFTLLASFQKEEAGFEHQEAKMPLVPPPEKLLSMEELWEKRLTDPRLPMVYRNKVARKDFVPWPFEMRYCEMNHTDRQYQSHPSLKYWFKARGQLSDDLALHRCVVAYASDFYFFGVSLNPHRKRGLKTVSLSLDHSMWFHRPFRADEWLLFVIESPSSGCNRGFVSGRMFNQKGEGWKAHHMTSFSYEFGSVTPSSPCWSLSNNYSHGECCSLMTNPARMIMVANSWNAIYRFVVQNQTCDLQAKLPDWRSASCHSSKQSLKGKWSGVTRERLDCLLCHKPPSALGV